MKYRRQGHCVYYTEYHLVITTKYRRKIFNEGVKEYFKEKTFQTVVFRNVKLSEAPSSGKPILEYDIVSTGSENYFQLAEEIIKADGKEKPTSASPRP